MIKVIYCLTPIQFGEFLMRKRMQKKKILFKKTMEHLLYGHVNSYPFFWIY